jgi:hypothetical protein
LDNDDELTKSSEITSNYNIESMFTPNIRLQF